MFDSWTKSKFYAKCKTLLKVAKTRLDGLIKKKATIVRYLKNDIADLLKTGLDSNAYGRAEGLLIELNAISRYEMLKQFCHCIAASLKELDKQKECLESCKESVQTLVFAAARFAEFPELRELRSLFIYKYGNSSESFVNKEFAAKLENLTTTKEMKLQMIRDVAKEFSIDWNSKPLEHKIFTPKEEEKENLGNTEHGRNRRGNVEDERGNMTAVNGQRRDDYKPSISSETGSSASSTLTEEDDGGNRRDDLRFRSPPYVKPRDGENRKVSERTAAKANPKSVRSRPRNIFARVENGDGFREKKDESAKDGEMENLSNMYSVKESKRKGSFSAEPIGEKQLPVHARSHSMQPQIATVNVHPNLPDYDNLAARLAALRGR